MKTRLILLLLCVGSALHALAGAEIETELAALYWEPCTVGRTFATFSNAQDPNVLKLATVDPDFSWGVRVGAKYTNTCSNLWLKFGALRLWSVDHARLKGGGFTAQLIPNAPIAGLTMKDVLDIDYYTIDLSGGHTWRCGRRLAADLFVLARYAFLRRQENGAALSSTAPTIVQTLRLTGRYKGGGFGLGCHTHYALACAFSLRATLLVGGLYGEQLYGTFTKITQNDAPISSTRLRDNHYACLPFFDVKAALEYSRWICDFLVIAGQLGWEHNNYFGALPIPGSNSLVVGVHRRSIGFGGPFINLALRF